MGILWKLRCDERRWATTSTTTESENSCTKKSKGAQYNVRFSIFHCFSFLFFRSKSNVRDCLEKKENKEKVYREQPSLDVHFRCVSSPGTQIDIVQDWMTNAIFLSVSAVVFAFFAGFSLRLFFRAIDTEWESLFNLF